MKRQKAKGERQKIFSSFLLVKQHLLAHITAPYGLFALTGYSRFLLVKQHLTGYSRFFFPLSSFLLISVFATPFTFSVLKDGAPENFEKLVREAFGKWQAVPSTTLKVDAPKTETALQFRWGGTEPELNPDLATRTIFETGSDGKESIVVSINPDTPDLESALLLETGIRLGLPLEPMWDGKRSITEADITLLRQQYAPNGDLTADGKVNIDDFEVFAKEFGKSQVAGGIKGDFNGDGKVDNADFEILSSNYDFGKQPGIEEPKPAEPKPTTPTDPTPTTPTDPTPTKPVDPTPTKPVDPTPTDPNSPPTR